MSEHEGRNYAKLCVQHTDEIPARSDSSLNFKLQFLEVYRRMAAPLVLEPNNSMQLSAPKLAKQVITTKMGE